jgi:hypothetical protein
MALFKKRHSGSKTKTKILHTLNFVQYQNIKHIFQINIHSHKHRLRVSENRVLRRIFGPRRDEVTGDWRKLHNEELHNLYSSPIIIRMIKSRGMRWAGHAARMGKTRNAYRILVRKPEGKKPLGRPRRRVGGEY